MVLITVCICTFQRASMLETCLASLKDIQAPLEVDIQVIVIDNDVEESSKDVALTIEKTFQYSLKYIVEARRGIPCARNRAIEESLCLGAKYLVFIDDDEWVESDWLIQLYDYCSANNSNIIVSGHVIQKLPEFVPEHILCLFEKEPKRKTGDQLNACATNNVLIPSFIFSNYNLRFDETEPFSGGTDTKFFVEARERGIGIVKCLESVVYESIPESRATLQWFSKRKYRAGITEAWRKQKIGRTKIDIMMSSIMQIIINLISCGVYAIFFQRCKRNKLWLKVCRSLGVFMGLFGAKVDSYKTINKL